MSDDYVPTLCGACKDSTTGWCPEHPPFKASPVVDRLWVTPSSPETESLAVCCRALDGLDPESAGRVLDYLTARYRKETASADEA